MTTPLAAANLVLEEGSVAELRILNTRKGTVSGYFDDFDKLAQAASEWDGKAPGVYVTLNPVNPDLLARASNHVTEFAKHTTSDTDVARRRWLPVDCDPVRPSGISSTTEEHDAAIARAKAIGEALRVQGWPRPVWSDSGNGGHLLYRIDLPNDQDSTDLIKRCLEALDLLFSDDAVTVDVTNHNPARIWKLYGTKAAKGDSTEERPHRPSSVLYTPPEPATVDVALLRELAGSAPQRAVANRTGEEFDLDAFIAANNLPVARTGTWTQGSKWLLNPCPWNPEHTDGSAYIVQFHNGAIAAGCHHNGCTGNDWAALRTLYDPGYERRREQRHNGASAPAEITTTEPEAEDAPHVPVLVRLSDVTPREVQWLWPGRVPLGKITIVAGDPGLMKSMLSLDMAARVSRGSLWPDGGNAPLGDVLLLTAEDDLPDTVRPRLDTLGADCGRITALTMIWTPEGEVAFNLHDHLPMLERAITPETRLIIIDPVLAFTGGTDTHVSAQVRGVLAPLAKLAQEAQVSVTGIIHLNKKVAGNAFQRILASIDFSAAPRSVLLVGEDADDPTLRHFAVVKNNLAPPAETLTYRWSDGGFTWTGKSDLTAHQLLAAPADGEGRTALIEAKEVLEELLSAGPMPPTEIRKAALAAGVKESTLRAAKDALGVRAVKLGFGEDGQWKWELPALRRGENTDPTLDGSDKKHRGEPHLSESPTPPKETPDDGQRLYVRSLWEGQGRQAPLTLSEWQTVSDPERFIEKANADELAALIAALEETS